MMHDGWGSMGWGWSMGFGMLFWFLVLILVVMAFAWLLGEPRRADELPRGRERLTSALDILEERYARGEIEREEYLQKKQDIGGDDAA